MVHYAAIELRYGIELLMAELLVISGKLISESDYQAAIGNEFGRKKKELSEAKAKYEKLALLLNEFLLAILHCAYANGT